MDNTAIKNAMTIRLDNVLPEYPKFVEGIRRAPDRGFRLTKAQAETALRNALRYVPEELHEALAPEFIPPRGTHLRQEHRRIQGQLHRGQGVPGDDGQ